jgi:FKBP-type peptidyl-prolyl cis-trans isomerase
MKKAILICISVLSLLACKSDPAVDAKNNKPIKEAKNTMKPLTDKSKLDSLSLDNGLKIHWLKRGSGDKLQLGDCINIAYKVFLDDGKLIEGNHKLNKPFVPFVVGFGMQTKGWDLALNELKVGDEVEVFVPSKLARGEKGIEGMIPPNSNNILYLKVIEKRKPTREIDGNKVYVFEENQANKVKFNRENTIAFYSMTSSESTPFYFNSFREGRPFEMKMKDAGIVPGLKKSLNNAKKADRMYVVVPPTEAYGDKGYMNFVGPNEHLLFNIYVDTVYN